MNNKKVLITGGSGFIGANLARKLVCQGYDTTLILKKESNLWRLKDIIKDLRVLHLDLLNKAAVRKSVAKIKPNLIFHLAAYGAYSYQDEADKILKTDIFGTLNLLDACKETDFELFVNTGSSSEYGFKKTPMKESDILEPNSFYAIAKAAQTHLSSYFAKTFDLPIVTLRPFSVYGPYEEPGRLIPTMMKAFYKNSILKMVSKEIVRDFIYVDDYVDACLNIENLKKYPGKVFNIGTGVQTSFDKLIKTFQKVSRIKNRVEWNASEGKKWDSNFWKASTTKTSSILNFKPKNSLEEGLQKNWKWFKTHHQLYDKDN